jgi:hypothetical protein
MTGVVVKGNAHAKEASLRAFPALRSEDEAITELLAGVAAGAAAGVVTATAEGVVEIMPAADLYEMKVRVIM